MENIVCVLLGGANPMGGQFLNGTWIIDVQKKLHPSGICFSSWWYSASKWLPKDFNSLIFLVAWSEWLCIKGASLRLRNIRMSGKWMCYVVWAWCQETVTCSQGRSPWVLSHNLGWSGWCASGCVWWSLSSILSGSVGVCVLKYVREITFMPSPLYLSPLLVNEMMCGSPAYLRKKRIWFLEFRNNSWIN